MGIKKGLVIGKPPMCRLGLSGRLSIRQDEHHGSSQQPWTRNIPNQVIPRDPALYPVKMT